MSNADKLMLALAKQLSSLVNDVERSKTALGYDAQLMALLGKCIVENWSVLLPALAARPLPAPPRQLNAGGR